MAGIYQWVPRKVFTGIAGGCSAGLLAVEILRYKKGFRWINRVYKSVFGGILRKHEMDGKFTGTFYYFAGITITALLFPPNAAVLGMCQLALADPSASFFGRKTKDVYWSRIEDGLGGLGRNKGVLGFLGGAVVCMPFNFLMLKAATMGGTITTAKMAWTSLAIGMAGSFADLAVPTPTLSVPKGTKVWGVRIPPFHVDDNFVVPIVAGFAADKIMAWQGIQCELAKFLFFN